MACKGKGSKKVEVKEKANKEIYKWKVILKIMNSTITVLLV